MDNGVIFVTYYNFDAVTYRAGAPDRVQTKTTRLSNDSLVAKLIRRRFYYCVMEIFAC